MNTLYHLQFEKLCSAVELGTLIKVPEKVSGGLLHRMFAVETTSGKYAVKALNPQIMARPTALQNYIQSEKIAAALSRRIPALPAKVHNDTFLHNVDNQFYMVFDWMEGRHLEASQTSEAHCKKIGSILSDIHRKDGSQMNLNLEPSSERQPVHWEFYLLKGEEQHAVWASLLSEHIKSLQFWGEKSDKAMKKLEGESVLSHRDLEPKNVMWIQGEPILIDWESAGPINPKHDLIETALYWSVHESGGIDKEKFDAFLEGYQENYGTVQADWRVVLDLGYLNKLEWLEYSLKRSLRIECTDDHEQEMGTRHVVDTIHALQAYTETSSMLEGWLAELN